MPPLVSGQVLFWNWIKGLSLVIENVKSFHLSLGDIAIFLWRSFTPWRHNVNDICYWIFFFKPLLSFSEFKDRFLLKLHTVSWVDYSKTLQPPNTKWVDCKVACEPFFPGSTVLFWYLQRSPRRTCLSHLHWRPVSPPMGAIFRRHKAWRQPLPLFLTSFVFLKM